jgi:hypothetical protein
VRLCNERVEEKVPEGRERGEGRRETGNGRRETHTRDKGQPIANR